MKINNIIKIIMVCLVLTLIASFVNATETRIYPDKTYKWLNTQPGTPSFPTSYVTTSYDSFDILGNVLQETDEEGKKIFKRYTLGLPSYGWNQEYGSESSPAWKKEYYSTGLLKSLTDENGNKVEYTYDSFQRTAKIIKPGDTPTSPTVEYTYQNYISPSQPTKLTTKLKIDATKYGTIIDFYDGLGNLIQTQTKMSGDNYIVKSYEYNTKGLKDKEYKPTVYSTNGQYTTQKPSDYIKYEYTNDPLARLKKVTKIGNINVEYSYSISNANSIIQLKDERGISSYYIHNGFGNLIKVEQESNSMQYNYDATNNLINVADMYGRELINIYNTLGKLTESNHPDTGKTTLTYYNNGNLKTKTNPNGVTVTYTYDNLNRIKQRTYTNPNNNVIIYYGDDPASEIGEPACSLVNTKGRICKVKDSTGTTLLEYDALGRTTKEKRIINNIEYPIEYTYNNLDYITLIKDPQGKIIKYNYNILGQVESVEVNGITTAVANHIAEFSYTPSSLVDSITLGNSIFMDYGYDARDLVTSIKLTRGATNILEEGYTYDEMSNLKSIAASKGSVGFEYDNLNRLKDANSNNFYSTSIHYTYDKAGNRLQENTNKQAIYQYYKTKNPNGNKQGDAVTSSDAESHTNLLATDGKYYYEYDKAGNVIKRTYSGQVDTMTYDEENRLTSINLADGKKIENVYDYKGNRILKKITEGTQTTTTIFIYDQGGNLIYSKVI